MKDRRTLALLMRWNKELKIQSALGVSRAYTVFYGTQPVRSHNDLYRGDGDLQTVKAIHCYHAISIIRRYYKDKDLPFVECETVSWTKENGWEKQFTDEFASELKCSLRNNWRSIRTVPVSIEELEKL